MINLTRRQKVKLNKLCSAITEWVMLLLIIGFVAMGLFAIYYIITVRPEPELEHVVFNDVIGGFIYEE